METSAPVLRQNELPELEINLPELPVACISAILSFTTQRDVCRLSTVSRLFRFAANSDSIWSKFLPQKCYEILPRAFIPLQFASIKELYFLLCDSILIDGGRKIFWIERSTAKIGYMLSARELTIEWSDDQRYWRWVSRDDSRFEEVAELLRVCWLELRGEMDCTLLSSNTVYSVLFLLKFGEHFHGWTALPIKFSVKTPDGDEMETEYFFPMETRGERLRINSGGWMEVVAGEFTVRAADDDSSRIEFYMKEVMSNWWKRGLFVEGVRIEPRYS